MTEQPSPNPKKRDPTIWIVVGIALLLVLCVVAVVGVGGAYFLLQRSGKVTTILKIPPSLSTPIPTLPGGAPPASGGTLTVEPFDPSTSSYPALPDLVANWTELTKPGSQTWPVSVPSAQPTLVFLGWCTSTPQILQQNEQQIKWTLTVDGQNVDVQKLFAFNEQLSDRVCQSSVGLIRQWPSGTHTIVTTMTVAQQINDGWNNYAAGDYTDTYTVTVSP